MKKLITLVFAFYSLGALTQTIKPIDEISIGVNYTTPIGHFFSSTKDKGDKVISENFKSKPGFSIGLINIGRKTKIFQFVYGVEFNFLSSKFEVDYDRIPYNISEWQGVYIIQDKLSGDLNSMLVSVPLNCRINFKNINHKTPFFLDLGIKYDFITAYRTNYKMDYYASGYISTYYKKESLQEKSRFYNKKANLGLNVGIGASIKNISAKLTYTYNVSKTPIYTIEDTYHIGRGHIRMSYLNFSINYKLRK